MDNEKWHGTAGGYSNHKCRCDPCRTAWVDMAAELRRKRQESGYFLQPHIEHGLASTYNAGCRCQPCTAEATRVSREQKLARMSAGDKPADGKCECCGRVRPLVVDHSHGTGQFRGWICHSCNTGIGKLGDDIEGVMRAVAYLNSR